MSATKLFEGMFLFDSNLAAKDWPGLESHVQDLLSKYGAEIVHSERWPDRKLSYEIKGCKKGTYYLTYFQAPPDAIQGLKRDTELSERILRLLVLYDEGLVEDCEKRARRAAEGIPAGEGGEAGGAPDGSTPAAAPQEAKSAPSPVAEGAAKSDGPADQEDVTQKA